MQFSVNMSTTWASQPPHRPLFLIVVMTTHLNLIGYELNRSCLLHKILAGFFRVLCVKVAQTDRGDQFRMRLRNVDQLDQNV